MYAFKTITVLLVFAGSSLAQDGITLGYVMGNDYLKLSELERTSWVVGAMDGIMSEAAALSKDPKGPWLGRCVKGVPTSQIKAMFEQELQAHPDSWHVPAAFIFRARLSTFCKSRI